jgi:PPE-repeat protein
MDFGVLPPEVSSGRMYADPGPATLLTAAAGWDALAAELHSAADAYQEVVTGLTDESWTRSIVDVDGGRDRALEAGARATAAAAAYQTAFAMTVPPPAMQANRVRLATPIATNSLGQNTPAIAAAEAAKYSEMWAQDATVMCNYPASAATVSAVKVLTSPHAIGPSVGTKAQTTSTRLMSAVTGSLQQLAAPGSSNTDADRGAGHRRWRPGQAIPLGTLSVPSSWADALSVATPEPVLDANARPGGWGATPSVGTGSVSRWPLGAFGAVGGRARVRGVQCSGLGCAAR